MDRAGLEQIGGHQRRDQARDQQRGDHRGGNGEPELLEILAGDAAHEAHWREHRDDGAGDRDDSQADLVGRLDCRLVRAFAHSHVPDDVLDLDDGVVHQDAGDEGDGEQADEVEREAHRLHEGERRDDGERQRDGGQHRRAPVTQEQQHDGGREHRALDQALHGGVVAALGGPHTVVDPRVDHVGIAGGKRLQVVADGVGDGDLAGALGAEDREGDDRGGAVQAGEIARLLVAVGDGGEVGEARLAAAGQNDAGGRELGERAGAAEGADGLLARAEFALAAGEVGAGGAQLRVDVAGGDPQGGQAVGVEAHLDLAR